MGAGQHRPIGAQQLQALGVEVLVGDHVVLVTLGLQPIGQVRIGAELAQA